MSSSRSKTIVAVDAMGGDHGPRVVIEGALEAARKFSIEVVLVGKTKVIEKELRRYNRSGLSIGIEEAPEEVKMDEQAALSVRKKKQASINVAVALVASGKADAVMSAGHTGAAMASAFFGLGRLPHISRPALTAIMPHLGGGTVFLDVGANVDCKPRQLEEFAIMGDVYANLVLDVKRPRVGLLSIGSERSKGNDVSLQALKILERLPLNFVGNVEGRDIVNGDVDVIVCDGFVGNVSLKLAEGVVELLMSTLKQTFNKTWYTKLAGMIVRPTLKEMLNRFDYAEYGGVPLLGLKGNCVIAHGGSSVKAIMNAVKFAAKIAERDVNSHIETNVVNYLGGGAA